MGEMVDPRCKSGKLCLPIVLDIQGGYSRQRVIAGETLHYLQHDLFRAADLHPGNGKQQGGPAVSEFEVRPARQRYARPGRRFRLVDRCADNRILWRLELLGSPAVALADQVAVQSSNFFRCLFSVGYLDVGPHAGRVGAIEKQRLFDQVAVPSFGPQSDPEVPVVLAAKLVAVSASLYAGFAPECRARGDVVVA